MKQTLQGIDLGAPNAFKTQLIFMGAAAGIQALGMLTALPFVLSFLVTWAISQLSPSEITKAFNSPLLRDTSNASRNGEVKD